MIDSFYIYYQFLIFKLKEIRILIKKLTPIMKTIENYKLNGFTKFESNFKNLIEPILDCYQEDLLKENNNIKIIGYSEKYNKIIEKITKDERIRSVLQKVLGENYKLHSAYIRKIEENTKGIRMHQDRPGETKLAILLSENTTQNGGTVFFQGTHKWPFILNSFPIKPEVVSKLLKGCIGNIGDMYLFSGRVWHGRVHSKSNKNITLLLSFVPSWVPYETRTLKDENLKKCSPFLKKLINPDSIKISDSPIEDKELFDMLTFKTTVSVLHPSRLLVPIHLIIKPIINLIRKLRGAPPISEKEKEYYKKLRIFSS